MLRRLLPLVLTAALLCPMTSFAQTPTDPTPPIASAAPAAPTPAKKADHINGKISSVDAAAKTITVTHGKKTSQTSSVISVPDGTKIYKADDAKGSPTGTFADLVLDTKVSVKTNGDETNPVAKTVHIKAPKTDAPAAPVVP